MRIRHGPARVEFHSHDQDETREYIRRNPADHSRVIRGKGRFLYRLSAVVAGRVIVGRTERWIHQMLRAAVRAVPSFRWAQNRHWAVSARISLEWLVAGLCVRLLPGAAHIESSVYLAEAEIDHG